MLDERGLHFHRPNAMAGDVQYVVDAAENPVVAVIVTLRAIAGEIEIRPSRPLCEIGFDVPRIVTPDRTQHRRPRFGEGEEATTDLDLLGPDVKERGVEAGERRGSAARLRLGETGQWRNDNRARLRLPPRIDDWAAAAADFLAIPHPRLGIDRLPD